MLIQKGFKYKLNPTQEQKNKLLQCGGNTRFLWNKLLEQNIERYKTTKKFIFYHEMATSLPKMKEEFDFLNESFSQSLQTTARQLDRALKDSFKKDKGFPRFKCKDLLNDSFTCPQKWKLYKGSVSIPKIGKIQWIKHRPLQGKPKHITITQDGNDWYCSVLCEFEVKDKEKKQDNIVGVDVGLKEFAVLSDETVIANPRHLKKKEKKLKKEQRRLSRKVKKSKNRLKQRVKVRRAHAKVKNCRKNFLHKTTSSMIAKYDGVVLENLNVKGMMKNHKLAKSISDVGWYEFRRQLEYKCRWNFKHFILIDRFSPTSKTCSCCGYVQDMPLEIRIYNCPNCGMSLDRDLNASLNIKRLGLNTLGRREIKACGESSIGDSYESRYDLMKQEKECLVN